MKSKYQKKYLAGLGLATLTGFAVADCSQNTQQAVAAPEHAHALQTGTGHKDDGHADGGSHGGAGHSMEGGHTHTTKLVFSSQPAKLEAGKVATWTLKVVDDIDNTPISDFEIVHDRLMHLILVSKDMSWFNHLHPEHKGKGVFEVKAALPRGGNYKLYADYRPKEREGEVAQHALSVSGAQPLPAQPKLVSDTARGAWMIKTVTSAPEGEPDKKGGPAYQVALMPMPAKIEAGKDVMLHFQVRNAAGKPVAKLEPYLGAMGHLVLVSADSNTYLHTHPLGGDHSGHDMKGMNHSAMPKGSGSDVMFHTKFPKAGLYKAWGQFQHGGKIITAAFVLNVGAAKLAAAPAKSASGKSSAKTANGVQRATVIIKEGYEPASLNVKAGQPVELTFIRREEFGCGDVVQIPALKLKTKSLKNGEKTTLTFTPKQTGTLEFTCGMEMYDGKIQVK